MLSFIFNLKLFIYFLLQKLLETNELVASMKIELTEMEPILKEKSEATKKLMTFLVKEKAAADDVRKVVATEEAVVKVNMFCLLLYFFEKKSLFVVFFVLFAYMLHVFLECLSFF